ncbi:MAG: hypothetical protein ACIAS6_10195 [Phycisphaerales bacterium JB060]
MRIPNTDEGLINFSRDHIDVWSGGQGTPPDTGLSSAQLAATESATAAAEAADLAARQARTLARTRTAARREAIRNLRAVIGGDVDTIDAYAKATGDPGVYERAQIPAPKTPSEREAPPAPTDLRTTVDTDGSVTLTFKVAAGGGASYLVQRRTEPLEGSPTPYVFIGFADDEKKFVDSAVPDGVRAVGYRVAARISTGLQSGWSVTRTIPFGSQANNPAGSIEPQKAEDQKSAG